MSDIKIIVDKTNLPDSIDFKSGLMLLVDKDMEWTSFDVVNKIRYAVKQKLDVKKIKVGHAGTLDPMATGLLLLCIGKYTKLIEQLQGMDKSYTGTVKLGATTPSYDAETEEDHQYPTDHITSDSINAVLDTFKGDQMQTPPMFSAIKVGGVRLYKKARKGEVIELKQRAVTFHSLDLIKYDKPNAKISCSVSKGTYIRSLAYDIGKSLDSGGYLTALRRTSVSDYKVENSLTVTEIIEWIDRVELIS